MTDLTAERREPGPGSSEPGPGLSEFGRGSSEPGPGPSVPAPRQPQPQSATPPSVAPGGVALDRLMSLARLTSPQALEIGAGVLAEAARRSEPDTGSPGDRRVLIGQVVIGDDGRVALGPGADGGGDGRPSPGGPTGSPVQAVLTDVAGAARHGARRPDPAAGAHLEALDRAVTDLPVAGVPVVARMLEDAAAAIDRGAVRAELAALVRAVGGAASSGRRPGATGNPPAGVRAAPGCTTERGRRTARRRIGAWLLSVLVLTGVVVVEVVVLRDDIATDVGLLLDAGRSGSTSSSAPEADGLPVVPPAPAAAGAVSGVDLRPLTACAPGAPCSLRLLVRLVPGADPQVVTWSYRVVDRCTGATQTAPGGTVTVPAGGERAAAVGTLSLPASEAVAVVAVTDLPAAAASPPVSVGSCQQAR